MNDPLLTFAVSASAITAGSTAIYCGKVARDVANTIQKNERRSRLNRRLLSVFAKAHETVDTDLIQALDAQETEGGN
ncbi:hypothetical protein [Haloarchaeobius sp. HME9146]|uniref:hypothetical protein n=1 Tax=Haloarchaeobius sp. HME9146 TaxID=2978732 RepID=UPI0021C0E1FE|nr:hypothetical protein [Haloarchaeobius sp. HME9146]MCT9095284.1 hypothetical protein [Haloarchaeobius sp. HME9146]